jgi:hypothetical protein
MAETPFDDVEQILDRHARRVARELGELFVDLGEALRKQADPGEHTPAPPNQAHHESREDLYREAARLDIKGRSRMSKAELREAIDGTS